MWVLFETETSVTQCFLVEVPSKSAPTLKRVTVNILLGTHIVREKRKSHEMILRTACGIYTHTALKIGQQ